MQISCPKDASLAFSRWALALGRIVAAVNGLHNLGFDTVHFCTPSDF